MLRHQALVSTPTLQFPFYVAANRYYLHNQPIPRPNHITLIFLHSTSFHKEVWEPSIFSLLRHAKFSNVSITDAYAIDCPNHGLSAVLNDKLLKDTEFGCQKYAEAAHYFLTHCGVDFSHTRLIGIGHSLGAISTAILNTLLRQPFKLSAILVIEPMFLTGTHLEKLRSQLIQMAYERRDVWPNRHVARQSVGPNWHPAVKDAFIKYGIRDHPTATHPIPYKGVTLACTRDQEALMYRDKDGATKPIADLDQACSEIPVHILYGDLCDYIPRDTQEAMIKGRTFASVTRIPNACHLVVQHDPETLARVLFRILSKHHGHPSPSAVRSKL